MNIVVLLPTLCLKVTDKQPFKYSLPQASAGWQDLVTNWTANTNKTKKIY